MIKSEDILKGIEGIKMPLQDDEERYYIGASSIGEPCHRKLWIKFNKLAEPEVFEPRMHRLFYRGKNEEMVFEYYLRNLGFEVIENCTSQARFIQGFFSGSPDGIVTKDGLRYVCEYKTHNDASFKSLSNGTLESVKPLHYSQIQSNAKHFNADGGIYMAVNKNNDELFCSVEPFNSEKANQLDVKAEYISMSDNPPERISNKPTAFVCKFCDVKDVCFGFEKPRINCMNCVNLEKKHGKTLCSIDGPIEQKKCKNHVFNPYFINETYGWKIVEFHPKEKAVQYENVINGTEPFGIKSVDLIF